MSLAAWLAFTLAYTLMALAPGPVVLMVVSYALAQGRRTAFAVVAGTTLGDVTCLTAAVLGLGALLSVSATAFMALKLVGAAYLVFMGVRLWRARPEPEQGEAPPAAARARVRVFLHAYLATALNPKSVLFFVIFAPQFMSPNAPLLPQLAAMAASILLCGALVDGGYSMFAASLRGHIRTRRTQRIVNRVTGGLLVGEGALAAASRGLAL